MAQLLLTQCPASGIEYTNLYPLFWPLLANKFKKSKIDVTASLLMEVRLHLYHYHQHINSNNF